MAYYFARDLQKVLQVPVGIIESDWGGTPAEAWMQGEFLHAHADYRDEIFGEWTWPRTNTNVAWLIIKRRKPRQRPVALNSRRPRRVVHGSRRIV